MTLRSAAAKTITWIDDEAKRLLKRREALCGQIAKFKEVHKALATVGVFQLYLNAQMSPTTQTAVPGGGKANLQRKTQDQPEPKHKTSRTQDQPNPNTRRAEPKHKTNPNPNTRRTEPKPRAGSVTRPSRSLCPLFWLA